MTDLTHDYHPRHPKSELISFLNAIDFRMYQTFPSPMCYVIRHRYNGNNRVHARLDLPFTLTHNLDTNLLEIEYEYQRNQPAPQPDLKERCRRATIRLYEVLHRNRSRED